MDRKERGARFRHTVPFDMETWQGPEPCNQVTKNNRTISKFPDNLQFCVWAASAAQSLWAVGWMCLVENTQAWGGIVSSQALIILICINERTTTNMSILHSSVTLAYHELSAKVSIHYILIISTSHYSLPRTPYHTSLPTSCSVIIYLFACLFLTESS